MGYYIAVSPPLKDENTFDAFFELLLSNNIVEAYKFAQGQDHTRHKSLFERIVISIHQEKNGSRRAERATLFFGLPFSSEEETWFEDFVLNGNGSKLPGAKDSVMVRRIARGISSADATVLNRLKGESIGGLSWDYVRTGIDDALPK